MTTPVPQTRIDPLHAFIAGAFIAGSKQPIPLIDTRFDVAIDGGLAAVSTARTFRNAETVPIEATITFPVPVHATLFELKARIGERTLIARASRKDKARESYESAIDRGKTAILHEEVLRGVHMLSVGQLAPGAEIEVETRFALALTDVGGCGRLRIPLTVGEIYGRSPLPDSDDLISGGAGGTARLTVKCEDGCVALLDGELEDGSATVPLDAPIDLQVTGWTSKDLRGLAADGSEVIVRVEPAPAGDAALDLALLVDHSGSMGELCGGDPLRLTKHQALVQGLETIVRDQRSTDRIDVWQFNDSLTQVGWTGATEPMRGLRPPADLHTIIRHLASPDGGTEIGTAIEGVIAHSAARDLLLITDGKSYALDVHRLAQRGRRICVVLVGEDSLEANVGHLAALTEGEIFVVTGLDVGAALQAAIRAMRMPRERPVGPLAPMRQAAVRRGGMAVSARWSVAAPPADFSPHARAVAAFAASLALPLLPQDAAAALAEAEGLVSHLTSLVLVDEAAQGEAVLPSARKIPLPEPRTVFAPAPTAACAPMRARPALCEDYADHARFGARRSAREEARRDAEPRERGFLSMGRAFGAARGAVRHRAHVPTPPPRLRDYADRIDWSAAPARLQAGDLSTLDARVARAIGDAAARPDVVVFARKLGFNAVVLVIGLLARIASARTRSAARVARAILGTLPEAEIEKAAAMLGLA